MSLTNKLVEERRARLAAERLLEQKQAELQAANRKLDKHARALSDEISETRAEVQNVRNENARVKSDLTVANQKVEVAQRRLWHSIETIQDGFAFFDSDSRLIAANYSWLSVYEDLEMVKPGVSYVELLQLATEEGIINLEGMDPYAWREKMLDRWQSPNPEPEIIRLWNGHYVKIVDRRGHSGDVVNLALNITETVQYEKRLTEERRNAEAASRAKSAFLANMSHEIRTPMNGVVGMAELLEDTSLTEEQQLYASTIRNSGEALLVIINDVLDYSKIEAEKLTLHDDAFDLERCIHDVVMLMQPKARDKKLELLLDYDLFLPTQYMGDAGRIRQVMTNLIGNAVKFTGEGHVLVRVVGVHAGDDQPARINVIVEDTGIGIPSENLDHIFGEFNQVEDEHNRKFEGTGLGLAISQKLISMMGGEIWVESKENEGATFGFSVQLPVVESVDPDDYCLPSQFKHALIVEPHEATRSILVRQVQQMGIQTTCCKSGVEALKLAGEGAQCVLSAHRMNEMDGVEFAEALHEAGHDLPVILLSERTSQADQDPGRPYLHSILRWPVSRNTLYRGLVDVADSLSNVSDPPPKIDEVVIENIAKSLETANPSANDLSENSSRLRPLRVLAAEDNKTNRLVFSKMVKAFEIDLKFAENGFEAVELFQEFEPDIVFMDISMPGMDGTEATREIREIEANTDDHVPIIAMTAHAMSGDEDEILAAGLDHYLTKPLRKDAIAQQIMAVTGDDILDPAQGLHAAE